MRWTNPRYRSERLEFKDIGGVEFIWLLWRAQDGSWRIRQAGQKIALDRKPDMIKAIKTAR